MDLSLYSRGEFDRGSTRTREALWVATSFLIASAIPGSRWRVSLLRALGARIGSGVVIKPSVKIKFPWRLRVGDNSWIGEGAWIDNLEVVSIGRNVCISQAAYLCAGNHDWTTPDFALRAAPITIEDCCWIGARASLAPGTMMATGAVVAMGMVASGTLEPWTVYRSRPEIKATRRRIPDAGGAA